MKDVAGKDLPDCYHMAEVFFGDEIDGREEVGRAERESNCIEICHKCQYELRCLWRAMVNNEYYGVWGGMGEGERRQFQLHLMMEGYSEIPEFEDFDEFVASHRSFRAHQAALGLPKRRRHVA